MKRFPVTRLCPLTGKPHTRVVAYLSAGMVRASNPTYRSNCLDILGISPEDEFPIVEGPSGFIFSGWHPGEDFLRRVYEEVIDHSRTVTEAVGYRRALLEFGAAFLELIDRCAESNRPLKLLDFGCGYGFLLRMLGGRDIHAYGFEPSAARAERTIGTGGDVFSDLEAVRAVGPFDLFVCTEVLEHLQDPRAVLKFFRANAAPDALLAVTVPDCPKAYIERSTAEVSADRPIPPVMNPWEHLNYFSSKSLRQMLSEEGFTVLHDFGRVRAPREACARFGDVPTANFALNSLRIAKRARATRPSTELFCRCS